MQATLLQIVCFRCKKIKQGKQVPRGGTTWVQANLAEFPPGSLLDDIGNSQCVVSGRP